MRTLILLATLSLGSCAALDAFTRPGKGGGDSALEAIVKAGEPLLDPLTGGLYGAAGGALTALGGLWWHLRRGRKKKDPGPQPPL